MSSPRTAIQIGDEKNRRLFVSPSVFQYDPIMKLFYIFIETSDGKFIRLWLPEHELQAIKLRGVVSER